MKEIIVNACLDCPYHINSAFTSEFFSLYATLHVCDIDHKAISVVLPEKQSQPKKFPRQIENNAEIFNPELMKQHDWGSWIPKWCPLRDSLK
jgi:hypothetical protein